MAYPPLHALALAVSQDCSWVGRGFAGMAEHLTGLYKEALSHPGFALLEVLQPCVTFNRINTYQWFQDRVYQVEEEAGYDPENEIWAFKKGREWGENSHRGDLQTASPLAGGSPSGSGGRSPGAATTRAACKGAFSRLFLSSLREDSMPNFKDGPSGNCRPNFSERR